MKLKFSVSPAFRYLPMAVFLALFLFVNSPVLAESVENQHGAVDGHSHRDIKRGERFFKGLLPHKLEHQACVSCHNLTPTDTLNWNPSAIAIAEKYLDKDFAAFNNAVMNPGVGMLAQVHKDFKIEEEDLKTVKVYLDNLAMTGPVPQNMTINNLLLFLFLGLLITWALLELIFFRKIRYRFIPVLIFLGAFGYQAKMLVDEGIKLGRSEGYAPDQPIKFSHKVHVGENGIDCKYCHHTVEQGKSAGIPATNLCMNCHVLIREGTNSGKFEIAKIVEAVEKEEPVEWVRLHNLPDHVFFSHAIHVGVAKIDCQQCHGDVEEMDIMEQHADLSMGWCVNCHRDTEVQFTENGYYETFVKMHEEMGIEDLKKVTAADLGANDCMRCHY
ncbi:cytochrome c3 family protein [Sunxiuqinia elliptica]|uniref:Class III cytochrome C family protein n=1 Tax=Sunxiuqinia elliptica TaxID=655355 RepID=A0A4R6GNQ7_9BACT|nr:cytochrome c3 family protein [Sunxiuqinia elliptica]TDN96240.1 class III cytochrome C family protein [Sunxiuqinia elliptica]TDO67951.1 class III cytochrome C family protein [Sunxiuqinia elliptica]